MVCPNCGEALIKEDLSGQDVDTCPSCGGIWCPTANIGWYIRLYRQSNRSVKPSNSQRSSAHQGPRDHRSVPSDSAQDAMPQKGAAGRACPSCDVAMTELGYDPESKILLDNCPVCTGVWIDAGELEALTDYLRPPTLKLIESTEQALISDGAYDWESAYEPEQEFPQSEESRYFDDMKVPIIRRLLGIPCVERHLSTTPWVTIGIIVLNVILYFFLVDSAPDKEAVFEVFGFVPASFVSDPLLTLFTFFSSMFLHGDIGHLVGNMIFLWLFGGRIEEDFGHKLFIVFYLISGIAAGLMHALFNLGSLIPMVGASGAISGILGAFFILHPRLRVITYLFVFIPIRLSAAVYLGFWLVMQILNSIVTASVGGAGIAWFAHIGGFIVGALMTYPLRSSNEVTAKQISQAA